MSILDKKNENTPKNAKKLIRILNIKMSPKGGPIFIFSVPGGRLAPANYATDFRFDMLRNDNN